MNINKKMKIFWDDKILSAVSKSASIFIPKKMHSCLDRIQSIIL